jgi:hypothetical protein
VRKIGLAAAVPFATVISIQIAIGAEATPSNGAGIAQPRVSVRTGSGCRLEWLCGPIGCGWYHVCRSRCPDRYSCFSLYGAYQPYGGAGYWGAYTFSGWTYRP